MSEVEQDLSYPRKPVLVFMGDVLRWPEFIAFAERLGIDLSKRNKTITIVIDTSKPVSVDHSYFGGDGNNAGPTARPSCVMREMS